MKSPNTCHINYFSYIINKDLPIYKLYNFTYLCAE